MCIYVVKGRVQEKVWEPLLYKLAEPIRPWGCGKVRTTCQPFFFLTSHNSIKTQLLKALCCGVAEVLL